MMKKGTIIFPGKGKRKIHSLGLVVLPLICSRGFPNMRE